MNLKGAPCYKLQGSNGNRISWLISTASPLNGCKNGGVCEWEIIVTLIIFESEKLISVPVIVYIWPYKNWSQLGRLVQLFTDVDI